MARVTITLSDRKGRRGGVIKKVVTHFEDGEDLENTPAVVLADKMLKAIGMGVGVGVVEPLDGTTNGEST